MQAYYAILAVLLLVLVWTFWPSCRSESESFYSTIAPLKNFPEVIGLPLKDAEAYMQSKYPVRAISTPDDAYRQDMSTVYLVVDSENTVIDVL